MNRTSWSSSDVRTEARSPARSIAGPDVYRTLTPSSRATIVASVVLPRPGRAVEEDVVGRLSPALRGLQEHREVGLDLALADVFVEGARSKGAFDDEVHLVSRVRRQDAREVVRHRGGV